MKAKYLLEKWKKACYDILNRCYFRGWIGL